jgi:hypothetical protein
MKRGGVYGRFRAMAAPGKKGSMGEQIHVTLARTREGVPGRLGLPGGVATGRLLARGVIAALILAQAGCLMDWLYGDIPTDVRMEPGVHAIEGLNTPFDEINATPSPPRLAVDAYLVFASNARSRGGEHTLEVGRLGVVQNPYSRRRVKQPPPPRIVAERIGPFPGVPESRHHVRGPTPLTSSRVPPRHYEEGYRHYLPMELMVTRETTPWRQGRGLPPGGVWSFDSDREGRRNLYYLDAEGEGHPFFGNLADADDAYATYDFERHELYFSSTRSGRFRIYRYRNTGGDPDLAGWLGDASRAAAIEPVTELDGGGNALAPFIEGDLLVFTSDRPGGHGGYDLYLSRRAGDAWGAPRNLQELMPEGVELNTADDELRASILVLGLEGFHTLRLLVFSSNRPGGQGGYDLYLTALPELDEEGKR